MSDKGDNVKKVFAPGFWIDTDDTLHFDAVKFLEGAGIPATPENIEAIEEEAKNFARGIFPQAPIIDLFDR
jgi:hypothetical protein